MTEKERIRAYVLICLVLASLVGSCIFLRGIYLERAFNIDVKSQINIHVQNGHEVRICSYSYIVENYVPFARRYRVYPILYVRNSTHHEQYNYPISNETLTKLEISIDSFERKTSYGDEELIPTFKKVNPQSFEVGSTMGLAKTTLLINWRYNVTGGHEPFNIMLRYSSDPDSTIIASNGTKIAFWRTFGKKSFPYLYFAASGFIFSLYAFQRVKLTNDYGVLSKFPEAYQAAGASEKKKMEASLQNIVEFPRKVGSFWRLVFGLNVFVVKSFVNDECKKHSESVKSNSKIAPFRRDTLFKIFSKGKKSAYEKIIDALPELKTISIVATTFAALGVTLSFNVPATAAALHSLALCYFFINLGSISQIVRKSPKDFVVVLGVTLVAISGILLQELIFAIRIAS